MRHNCLVNISETLENVVSVVIISVVNRIAALALVYVCPPSRVHIPPVTRSFIIAFIRLTLIVHIFTAYSIL